MTSTAIATLAASLLLVSFGAPAREGTPLPLPPRLVAMDTIGSESDGADVPLAALRVPVTALRLRFDRFIFATPDGFRVAAAGEDGRFDKPGCAQLGSDDVVLPLAGVHVDGPEVTLRIYAPRGLLAGDYRVIACGTLLDLDGIALDGDNDGLPGGDAVRPLLIGETPQLENPNLDTGIAGWSVASLAPGAIGIAHDSEDADGSPRSGSVRITSSGAAAWLRSTTCVQVGYPSSGVVDARTRLRYRVLQGRVRMIATASFGFGPDQGEPDCLGPTLSTTRVLEYVAASPTFATWDSGARTMDAMPLAGFDLLLVGDGQPFEVLLDDIGLTFDTLRVFGGDFEDRYAPR